MQGIHGYLIGIMRKKYRKYVKDDDKVKTNHLRGVGWIWQKGSAEKDEELSWTVWNDSSEFSYHACGARVSTSSVLRVNIEAEKRVE